MPRPVLILHFCALLGLVPSQAQETFFEFIPGWRAANIYEDAQEQYRVRGLMPGQEPGNYHMGFASFDSFGQLTELSEVDDDSLELIGPWLWNSAVLLGNDLFHGGTLRIEGGESKPWIGKSDIQSGVFESIVLEDTCCFGHLGGSLTKAVNSELLFSSYRLTQDHYNYTSLSRYTTNLDRQWIRHFYCEDDTVNGTLQPYAIKELADESILLTTLADYYPGGTLADDYVQTILIRTDAQGHELWRTRPGDTTNYWIDPGMPVELDNGNIMAFWSDTYDRNGWLNPPNYDNTIHYGEVDKETGEVLWEADLDEHLLSTNEDPDIGHLYSIKQTQLLSDGNILVTGYDLRHAMLIKMTQTGEVIWVQFHWPDGAASHDPINVDTWLFEVIETSDGGLAGVGEFRADPGGATWPEGFQSAFMIKLDEYGCLVPDCQVGLAEYAAQDIAIYPNPTEGAVRFSMPEGMAHAEVEIRDQHGRLVHNQAIRGQDEVWLEWEGPAGVYTLSLWSYEKLYRARVIKK